MVSIYSVEANELILKAAEELKKIDSIKPPAWAVFVKTGISKQRPPAQKDWWYIRAAAILRSIYKIGPVGVNKLRTRYGSKKDRGVRPEHFYPASGNIIRKILQQLEKAELIKKGEHGVHKGKVIAPKGKSLLDKIAVSILKSKPKKVVKEEPAEEHAEEKQHKHKKEIKKEEPEEAKVKEAAAGEN
jgi:small subunit ribosomal protein S19e